MTYDVFKTALAAALQERLPEGTVISIEPVMQPEYCSPDGLVITEPGYRSSRVIYPHYYYNESVRNDTSVDDTADTILRQYRRDRQAIGLDLETFTDFKKIKDHIIYRLVNPARDPDQYDDVPLIPVLDLALTFYVLVDQEPDSMKGVLIHNSHLKIWGDITEQMLLQLAASNTPRLLPYQLDPITDVIEQLEQSADPKSHFEVSSEASQEQSLYVLTNMISTFGASCMFYAGLLEHFAKRFERDFYLIPSSVHEILLLPDYGCFSRKDLNDMVQEVNSTVLQKEDILSDHVYYYSREQKAVCM